VSVLEAQLEHLGHQEAMANQKSNLLDWIPQIFRAVKLCLIIGKSSQRRDLAEFSGMFWNISLVYKLIYWFATEYILFQVKPTCNSVSATLITPDQS